VTSVRPYESSDDAAWDALVRSSRVSHFLFLRDYMEYHSDRFEDASLLVFEDDALAAVLPANRVGSEVVSHGGLTFGGLVGGPAMSANGALRALEAATAWLAAEGVERLVYKPVPHVYHSTPAEEDLYAIFRLGARLLARDLSSAILLDAPLPYSKGRRASLKRAREQGIDVAPSEDFDAFIALAERVLERHDATPTHSAAELAALAARFPEHIHLVTARHGGELVAGVVVYETDVVAHTQYIAASESGKDLGAVDLIVDALIDGYKGQKRWFDFGISTERGGEVLNAGLVRNKESYGARAVVYDRYELAL